MGTSLADRNRARQDPLRSGAAMQNFNFNHVSLVQIAVVLVLVGLVLWLINTYIPMAGGIKSLLNIVVFVVILIWLLRIFGLIGNLPGVHIPPLN
jgi:uncharacterized Tic20 family protein